MAHGLSAKLPWFLLLVAPAAWLASLAACSSSSGSPADGGPPVRDDAAADAAVQDSSAPSDAPGDTGAAEAEADAASECDAYCSTIGSMCTGASAQYSSDAACMSTCALIFQAAALDAGAPGGPGSLACRMRVLTMSMYPAGGVCWFAGPFGYGACGQPCEDFCGLATVACPGSAGSPYASFSDCYTSCFGYPEVAMYDGGTYFGMDGGFNASGPTTGNTFDCREWQLLQALAGDTQHCANIGATSPACQ
jgi:hypothetical protein